MINIMHHQYETSQKTPQRQEENNMNVKANDKDIR